MPPPLQSDAFIRRMCPQNHPPPLGKIYNITSTATPKYLQSLPGIKPAAPFVISPVYMNTMAKMMAGDRANNSAALVMAQQRVLEEYAKPSPNVDKLLSQVNNLRGSETQTPLRDKTIGPSMLSNIATTLKGEGPSTNNLRRREL